MPIISRSLLQPIIFKGLALRWIAEASQRHQSHKALKHLDARMLKDLGLSPLHVAREAAKPFWRR